MKFYIFVFIFERNMNEDIAFEDFGDFFNSAHFSLFKVDQIL